MAYETFQKKYRVEFVVIVEADTPKDAEYFAKQKISVPHFEANEVAEIGGGRMTGVAVTRAKD